MRTFRTAGVLVALAFILEGLLRLVPSVEAVRIRGGGRWALPTAVSLLGQTIEGTELATPFTIPSGTQIDGGSGSSACAFDLPRKTDCSAVITEGRICWDTDDNILYVGDNASAAAIAMAVNAVLLTGNQTVAGVKTFSSGILGSIGAGPVDMLKFGNDTGKMRISQPSANLLQISNNWNPGTAARDDTGISGTIIELLTGGIIKIWNVGVFGPFALFWWDGAASLSLGTGATPGRNLEFGTTSGRTIGMGRNTTAATAGQSLTIDAGDAIAGTSNLNGGNLVLQPGISTGTGKGKLELQTTKAASGSGSSDNNPATVMFLDGGAGSNVAPHLETEDGLTAPTAGTCGTSPAITTGSSDTAGEITIGSGSPGTTCTVNFTSTWSNTPFCVWSWSQDPTGTGRYWITSSTTTVVLNVNTGNLPASVKWRWMCIGRQ